MRKLVILACLFLCLPFHSALASDSPPFELIYRQENVVRSLKWSSTRSDLMITVINLSGGEARDIVVSIPGPNPYLFVDSPVAVTTIPAGRQAEILYESNMPNDLIELADPEEKLVWRIDYTDAAGMRTSVEIPGVKAN
jgi:hypothetical protein